MNRRKDIAVDGLVNIAATVVRKKKSSAGVALAVSRSAKSVSRKISGVSVTVLPGSVLTVSASA